MFSDEFFFFRIWMKVFPTEKGEGGGGREKGRGEGWKGEKVRGRGE